MRYGRLNHYFTAAAVWNGSNPRRYITSQDVKNRTRLNKYDNMYTVVRCSCRTVKLNKHCEMSALLTTFP